MSNKSDDMKKQGEMGMNKPGMAKGEMGMNKPGMNKDMKDMSEHSMQVCCEECDWEAVGNDEDELAGKYQTHMMGEHHKKMDMAQCREQVEDMGAMQGQEIS